MSQLRIEAFQDEAVDETVFQLILTHDLYNSAYGSESGGLYDACNVYFDEGYSVLSHVWFVYIDGWPVAVAGIKHTGEPIVQMYVKPGYRRQGIGEHLLKLALATGEEFGAVYTQTSESLFSKHLIPDYRTNAPWMISQGPSSSML